MSDQKPVQDDPAATGTQQDQTELNQMKEIAQRALADLQNYKRKAEEERAHLLSLGKIQTLSAILPVLDNFKRAFETLPPELAENNFTIGIQHIEKQLLTIIETAGLQPIPAVNNPVDPTLHEVVSTQEIEDPTQHNLILKELEVGYTFQGKLVRPSKVIVGKSPQEA